MVELLFVFLFWIILPLLVDAFNEYGSAKLNGVCHIYGFVCFY